MMTILYEIEKHDCANDRRVVAVCSTKAKAQAKLRVGRNPALLAAYQRKLRV